MKNPLKALFDLFKSEPVEETWSLKRYVPHRLCCCVCKRAFFDTQIVLQSNLGRLKHRGC